MKTLNVLATALLLGTLTLGAATIDEQIEAIQNANTKQERVKLMNQFKTAVSTMTKEQRKEAMAQLRTSMEENGDQLQTQTRTRTRVQDGEQSGDMIRNQHMHQTQQASKQMHQNKINPGTGNNPGMGQQ